MGKILLLTPSFPPPDGGVERRYANLCRFFPAESIEVATCRRAGQDEFDAGEPYPIHRLAVSTHGDRRFGGILRWAGWTLRRVARGDVGVIWVGNLRRIGRIAWALRNLTGVPYGVSFYGNDLTSELLRPRSGWKWRLARRVLDGASCLMANSAHIASLAREHAANVEAHPLAGRLHVVRSGADLARFHADLDPAAARAQLGLPEGRLLLTVARLIPQKGVAQALHAFALIAAAHPDTHYAIAGEGEQGGELRELARELGLEARVSFLGRVAYEQMPLLQAAADIFVLTSRRTPGWTENFPNVCLEAMSAGKPVIAGRVGGVPEMVSEGQTGLLVDPEDPGAIAAALRRLLDEPDLARAMGAAGRKRVEREFTHERAAREMYWILTSASRLPLPPWESGKGRALAADGRGSCVAAAPVG